LLVEIQVRHLADQHPFGALREESIVMRDPAIADPRGGVGRAQSPHGEQDD